MKVRVLYSFPHKLGAERICYTAWQQVNGLAAAGAEVTVFPGTLHRPVAAGVEVRPTLSRGPLRIPYKLLGRVRALALHDRIVARRLTRMASRFDIVHAWPLGCGETLKTAAELGIPAVIERPNAHTRFAYETVRAECQKLGVLLPPGHEHTYNAIVLAKEEEEYRMAFRILCPSEFVLQTFLDQGFNPGKLLRHRYGYDECKYYADSDRTKASGITAIFVGVCAVRKGLHYALEAWLASPAHRTGQLLIVGEFLGNYAEKLAGMLSHPSIKVLGHRNDVPELIRNADVLVLPSIEEGFGLVCTDAIGCGCVPIVSDACTDVCRHMENALVHHVGDVKTLCAHITAVDQTPGLLSRLRQGCLKSAPELTWTKAGAVLLETYKKAIGEYPC